MPLRNYSLTHPYIQKHIEKTKCDRLIIPVLNIFCEAQRCAAKHLVHIVPDPPVKHALDRVVNQMSMKKHHRITVLGLGLVSKTVHPVYWAISGLLQCRDVYNNASELIKKCRLAHT